MSKCSRFLRYVCLPMMLGTCASASMGQQAQPAKPTPSHPSPQQIKASVETLAWQRRMAVRLKPATGCFTAAYPAEDWKAVKCAPSPKRPPPKLPPFLKNWPPRISARPGPAPGMAVVGHGNDIVATAVGGPITAVEGFFDQTIDLQSVSSVLIDSTGASHSAPDAFSLQINTAPFSSPTACAKAQKTNCQGWIQFLFFNDANGSLAQMEVWLKDYGATCPGQGSIAQLPGMPAGISWTNSGSDCSFYSGSTPLLAAQPVTALGQLRLRAEAAAGGSDSVTVQLPDGSISGFAISDELLNLSAAWQSVEFNVLGYVGGERAHFNSGAAVVVHVNIENGTSNAPTTINFGFTGETNTFNLVLPGCANAGNPPNVVFEEITLDNQKSLACPPIIPAPPTPPPIPCPQLAQDITMLAKTVLQESEHPPACPSGIVAICNQQLRRDTAALAAMRSDYASRCEH